MDANKGRWQFSFQDNKEWYGQIHCKVIWNYSLKIQEMEVSVYMYGNIKMKWVYFCPQEAYCPPWWLIHTLYKREWQSLEEEQVPWASGLSAVESSLIWSMQHTRGENREPQEPHLSLLKLLSVAVMKGTRVFTKDTQLLNDSAGIRSLISLLWIRWRLSQTTLPLHSV